VTTIETISPGGDVDAEIVELLLCLSERELARFMDQLGHDEVEVVERALAEHAALGWRATPTTMAAHLTPMVRKVSADGVVTLEPGFKRWRYAMYLGEQFRLAATGVEPRQIWNLPARYGKSLIGSQWGPVWAFDRDPTSRIILASYGDTLADENSDAVRQILREHKDVLRVELRRDRQRIDRFVTTEGGGLLAAGIDSGIVGFGADGAVVDDPFKNWQEAHSEARRNHVDNQFRAVIRLRLESDTSWLIVIHHRHHVDDLSGRLLQQMEDGTGERYHLVRLPAIAETPDPNSPKWWRRLPDAIGRAPGEPLEPERFSVATVKARALSIGTYLTGAMEQQDPAPAEGIDIKRDWFKVELDLPPAFDQMITSWDMKLKDKEAGDYVVGQAWGRTGKDCWLLDGLRGQWNQATSTNAIALLSVRHPEIRYHVIENTGNGPEVAESLRSPAPGYELSDEMAGQLGMTMAERALVQERRRRGLGGLIMNNPKGSKPVRMRAVIPYIEAGDVHVNAHWTGLGAYLDEMAAFPEGDFDDQCDATSQALARMHRLGVRSRRPTGQALIEGRASTV